MELAVPPCAPVISQKLAHLCQEQASRIAEEDLPSSSLAASLLA